MVHKFCQRRERQVRPLTKLEPDQQQQVWQEAVVAAGGKVPSGRLVKDAEKASYGSSREPQTEASIATRASPR